MHSTSQCQQHPISPMDWPHIKQGILALGQHRVIQPASFLCSLTHSLTQATAAAAALQLASLHIYLSISLSPPRPVD